MTNYRPKLPKPTSWDPQAPDQDWYESPESSPPTDNGRRYFNTKLVNYFDPTFLDSFVLPSTEDILDPSDEAALEEIYELQKEVVGIAVINMPSILTDAQYRYFYSFYVDNLTQTEIAALYQVNQASVSKALFGEYVKHNMKASLTHYVKTGGAIRRIQKWIQKNDRTKPILAKIKKIGKSLNYTKQRLNRISATSPTGPVYSPVTTPDRRT